MYDTVNLRLTRNDVPNIDFYSETASYLEEPREYPARKSREGYGILSNKGNLTINILDDRITVTGSLCKWWLGDNMQSMTRTDAKEAIEWLSEELHLPMEQAEVTRLDIGCSIITKHTPIIYLNYLGSRQHSRRVPQEHGLYYHRSNWQTLCFYDKIKELKHRRDQVPPQYQDKNVLRYEIRYVKDIANHLNMEAVNGATLSDDAFCNSMERLLLENYNAIKKIKRSKFEYEMKSVKDLRNMGVLFLVEQAGGLNEFVGMIDTMRKQGKITSKQAYDMRKEVTDACCGKYTSKFVVQNEEIDELDKAIFEAAKFYR